MNANNVIGQSNMSRYNLEVFMEPRGMMRIIQLVFAVIITVVLRSYSGSVDIEYKTNTKPSEHVLLPIEYPYNLRGVSAAILSWNGTNVLDISLGGDFSCAATSLFSICWMSIAYALITMFVYIKKRELYESRGNLVLVDLFISALIFMSWLNNLSSWGSARSMMEELTSPESISQRYCNPKNLLHLNCVSVTRSSFSGLTISLILSFLNFFLWVSGTWFIFKETSWYQQG